MPATWLQKQNNGKSTLTAGISNSDLSITVSDFSKFPIVTPFHLTIWDSATYQDPGDDPNMEVVKVTSLSSGLSYTIERAKESTTAHSHNSGSAVAMLITAQHFTDIESEFSNYLRTDNTNPFTPTADYHPATKVYVDSQISGENHWDISISNVLTPYVAAAIVSAPQGLRAGTTDQFSLNSSGKLTTNWEAGTNGIYSNVMAAYDGIGQAYSYSFDTALSKYAQIFHDGSYAYITANTDLVIASLIGSNVIINRTIAQLDVVSEASGGITPEAIWILQSVTSGISDSAYSLIQQNLAKDHTAILTNNGLFQNITGNYNVGTHIHLDATADNSWGLVQGIHGAGQVGQMIGLDGVTAYFQRIYQYITGSNTISEYRLNEIFTGTLSGTTFTGRVIDILNSQTSVWRINYDGSQYINTNSTSAFLVEWNGVKNNVFLIDTTNARVSVNTTAIGYALEVVNLEAQARAIDVRAAWTTRPGSFAIGMGASVVASFSGAGMSGGIIAGFFSISDSHVVNTLSNDITTGYDFTASRASPHSSIGLSNTFRMMRLSQSDVGSYIRSAGNTTNTTPNMTLVNTGTFTYNITGAAASRTMTHTHGAFDATITLRPTIVGVSGAILATLNSTNFFANVSFSNTGGNPTLDANSLWNVSYGGMRLTGTYLNTSTSGTVSSISYGLFSSATGADKDFFIYNGTVSDSYAGLDNAKLLFGTGTSTAIGATLTYNEGDVFIRYTGTIWQFDIAATTTSIDFNPSVFDTDFNVWGDTDTMLHLDAGGAASYLEQQVANSTTFFQYRQLDGTVFVTIDSSTPAVLMATSAPLQLRASTQSIYSSAAGTLDLDSATTINFRIGGTVKAKIIGTQTWAITNGAIDRAYDANATTVEELADAFYTLIEDLKAGNFPA